MAFQLLLNFLISFIWMFLKSSFAPDTFLIGYIIGLLLIFVTRRFFPTKFYLIQLLAILKLLWIFIKELIIANVAVLKIILQPKLAVTPGIFAMKTVLTKDWEITVLCNLITLTPGTLVLDISEDNSTLYIHAMDISDKEATITSIRNSFEKAILEVSN
ncbi:Na+/H+ antiporter subunit E [Bacillus sp. B1-b2]|uniref:Na+/H+ antiporter subunit E n=1 Tax=Bacillus sp. B1-b2 TaxID=2653201 RepID=UPI001262042D|nr:Na+/H+ antiporter subunit E [Bacillus sp. B1-b2]KAB7667121.1 Na+/H+ antiporter subunit E [Bacillus sp. B1-b2]